MSNPITISGITTPHTDTSIYSDALSYTSYSTPAYSWVENLTTRKDLREYCQNNIIDKAVFDDMEERIPLGADLLTELVKIGEVNHPYIKRLLRDELHIS